VDSFHDALIRPDRAALAAVRTTNRKKSFRKEVVNGKEKKRRPENRSISPSL
jgi:hypothetical protein